MHQLAAILIWIIDIFRIVLLGRIVLDWIRAYNRSFKPKGFFLVLAETAYLLTDWVVKPISRLIKPIKVGGGYLDISIFLLFLALGLLDGLLATLT
ncbi:MAG: YggT family protein [Actinomycetes bacterium]